jgi:hypothetical protein
MYIRAAQTGVFDLDIRISNGLFIDVCASCVAETGLKSRNVEKKINDCLSGPIMTISRLEADESHFMSLIQVVATW